MFRLIFRYVCLLCNKLFTSRYNIRMHLNTHTGRNVHTCPYCNIQFISRQSYESHIKVHGNSDSNAAGPHTDPNAAIASSKLEKDSNQNGPQIVSVKSINTFENVTHEEIQIEPDIIEEDNYLVRIYYDNKKKLKKTSGFWNRWKSHPGGNKWLLISK